MNSRRFATAEHWKIHKHPTLSNKLTSAWNGLGLLNIISSSPDMRRKPLCASAFTWWVVMVTSPLVLNPESAFVFGWGVTLEAQFCREFEISNSDVNRYPFHVQINLNCSQSKRGTKTSAVKDLLSWRRSAKAQSKASQTNSFETRPPVTTRAHDEVSLFPPNCTVHFVLRGICLEKSDICPSNSSECQN